MAQQEQKSSSHDFDKIWKLMMENREQMKETNRQLRVSMAETDRQMKETDRRMKELQHLFTGHWGKLMESLTTGGLKLALKERNIEVTGISSNLDRTYNHQKREFDIVATNGKELVVVEVKTTLKLQQVRLFVKNLKNFKSYFPEYKDKTVYGAMAYLKSNEGAGIYAEKQGLFILNPVGNIVKVMNSTHFSPKPMA